jgi:hypothetical protein
MNDAHDARRLATLAFFVVGALAIAVALPSLRSGYSLDAYLILDDPRVRDFTLRGLFGTPWGGGAGGLAHAGVNASYYRPLTELLYMFERALFGLRPFGWHGVSMGLHVCSTLLCLSLARRITRNEHASIAAAALFALHPVHAEAITVIAYQTTLLSATFALVALVCFGRLLDGRSPLYALAAGAATMAALAAKEEAAALPALALAWAIFERPQSWRRALALGVGAMAIGELIVLAQRAAVVEASSVTYFGAQPRGFTMLGVVALYAELLLMPLRLCHFYDWFLIPIASHFDAAALRGLACVALLVAAISLAGKRSPPLAIALAWLALALLPMMQLLPMLNVAAERFLYLPSVGWAIACGLAYAACARRQRRASLFVGVTLLALYGLRTGFRLADFHDDRSILAAEARDFPETPTPLVYLADLDQQAGDVDAARAHLEEAIRRAPGWPVAAERLRALPLRAAPP